MKNPFDWTTMDWQKAKRKRCSTYDARDEQLAMKIEKFFEGFGPSGPPTPQEKKKEPDGK